MSAGAHHSISGHQAAALDSDQATLLQSEGDVVPGVLAGPFFDEHVTLDAGADDGRRGHGQHFLLGGDDELSFTVHARKQPGRAAGRVRKWGPSYALVSLRIEPYSLSLQHALEDFTGICGQANFYRV